MRSASESTAAAIAAGAGRGPGDAHSMERARVSMPASGSGGNDLDGKHQHRVRRNRAVPAGAVAQRRRNDQLTLATHVHARDTLLPARDHFVRAEPEAVGITALVAVEARAIGEPAGIVHRDLLAPR